MKIDTVLVCTVRTSPDTPCTISELTVFLQQALTKRPVYLHRRHLNYIPTTTTTDFTNFEYNDIHHIVELNADKFALCDSNRVHVWELESASCQKHVCSYELDISAPRFAWELLKISDNKLVVLTDTTLLELDLVSKNAQVLDTFKRNEINLGNHDIIMIHNGEILFRMNKKIQYIDITTKRKRSRNILISDEENLDSMAIISDNMIALSTKCQLMLYNTRKDIVAYTQAQESAFSAMIFVPELQRLVCCSITGKLKVIDIITKETVGEIEIGSFILNFVQIAPNLVAACSVDTYLFVLNVQDITIVKKMSGYALISIAMVGEYLLTSYHSMLNVWQ